MEKPLELSDLYVARQIKINLLMPTEFDKKELGRSVAMWLRERQKGKLLGPIKLKREFNGQFYLRMQAAVPQNSEVALQSYLLVHGLEEYLRTPLCIERVYVDEVFSLDPSINALRGKTFTLRPGVRIGNAGL